MKMNMPSTQSKKEKDNMKKDQKKKDESGKDSGTTGGDSVDENENGASEAGRARDVCGYCNESVTDKGRNSDGLYCDYCNYWYHARCEGMSLDTYQKFSDLTNMISNMSYYCDYNHCKVVSKEVLKQIGPVRQKVDANTRRIEAIEVRLDNQDELIETTVIEELGKCLDDKIEQKVQTEWENIKDREVRSKNVMFVGVVESNSEDYNVRKQEDIDKINSLLRHNLGCNMDNIKITNAIRLRKRNEDSRQGANSARPRQHNSRLMKVIFENDNMVSQVIRSAKKLNESDDDNIKNIRMFRDMSRSDHEKRKVLVDEMKKRNLELEQQRVTNFKWVIRGSDVIKVRNENF